VEYDGSGRFAGVLKDEKPTGFGTWQLESGAEFRGVFHEGKASGWGRFQSPSQDYVYIGQFEEGLPHGIGLMQWEHQTYYGMWEKGQIAGAGLFAWDDGTEFEGQFEYGQRVGRGIERHVGGRQEIVEYGSDGKIVARDTFLLDAGAEDVDNAAAIEEWLSKEDIPLLVTVRLVGITGLPLRSKTYKKGNFIPLVPRPVGGPSEASGSEIRAVENPLHPWPYVKIKAYSKAKKDTKWFSGKGTSKRSRKGSDPTDEATMARSGDEAGLSSPKGTSSLKVKGGSSERVKGTSKEKVKGGMQKREEDVRSPTKRKVRKRDVLNVFRAKEKGNAGQHSDLVLANPKRSLRAPRMRSFSQGSTNDDGTMPAPWADVIPALHEGKELSPLSSPKLQVSPPPGLVTGSMAQRTEASRALLNKKIPTAESSRERLGDSRNASGRYRSVSPFRTRGGSPTPDLQTARLRRVTSIGDDDDDEDAMIPPNRRRSNSLPSPQPWSVSVGKAKRCKWQSDCIRSSANPKWEKAHHQFVISSRDPVLRIIVFDYNVHLPVDEKIASGSINLMALEKATPNREIIVTKNLNTGEESDKGTTLIIGITLIDWSPTASEALGRATYEGKVESMSALLMRRVKEAYFNEAADNYGCCTFVLSGSEPVAHSEVYNCSTCGFIRPCEGICSVCAKVCHAGHIISRNEYLSTPEEEDDTKTAKVSQTELESLRNVEKNANALRSFRQEQLKKRQNAREVATDVSTVTLKMINPDGKPVRPNVTREITLEEGNLTHSLERELTRTCTLDTNRLHICNCGSDRYADGRRVICWGRALPEERDDWRKELESKMVVELKALRPKDWVVSHVAEFCYRIFLEPNVIALMEENLIDGKTFLDLTNEDLVDDMGLPEKIASKILFAAELMKTTKNRSLNGQIKYLFRNGIETIPSRDIDKETHCGTIHLQNIYLLYILICSDNPVSYAIMCPRIRYFMDMVKHHRGPVEDVIESTDTIRERDVGRLLFVLNFPATSLVIPLLSTCYHATLFLRAQKGSRIHSPLTSRDELFQKHEGIDWEKARREAKILRLSSGGSEMPSDVENGLPSQKQRPREQKFQKRLCEIDAATRGRSGSQLQKAFGSSTMKGSRIPLWRSDKINMKVAKEKKK